MLGIFCIAMGRTGGLNPSSGLTRKAEAIDGLHLVRNNPRIQQVVNLNNINNPNYAGVDNVDDILGMMVGGPSFLWSGMH